MKKHAVGIVIKNRWNLTKQTLDSIFYSEQKKSTYDLFIIDNGSDTPNVRNLKDYIKTSSLPIKNMITLPDTMLSEAWNLFFALARNYSYRTKVDNDVIFRGTLPQMPLKKPHGAPSPADYGSNPGQIPTGPHITGAGMSQTIMRRRRESRAMRSHTKFLDHLSEFSKENKVDIVSLLPVSTKQTFVSMFNAAINKTWNGQPFLLGGCVQISKKCFDKIGYFHEMLSCRLDIEYTQRAIKNGFNIGYHSHYFITHSGAFDHTDNDVQRKFKNQESIASEQSNTIETFGNSKWEKVVYDLEEACSKDKVLHLV